MNCDSEILFQNSRSKQLASHKMVFHKWTRKMNSYFLRCCRRMLLSTVSTPIQFLCLSSLSFSGTVMTFPYEWIRAATASNLDSDCVEQSHFTTVLSLSPVSRSKFQQTLLMIGMCTTFEWLQKIFVHVENIQLHCAKWSLGNGMCIGRCKPEDSADVSACWAHGSPCHVLFLLPLWTDGRRACCHTWTSRGQGQGSFHGFADPVLSDDDLNTGFSFARYNVMSRGFWRTVHIFNTYFSVTSCMFLSIDSLFVQIFRVVTASRCIWALLCFFAIWLECFQSLVPVLEKLGL